MGTANLVETEAMNHKDRGDKDYFNTMTKRTQVRSVEGQGRHGDTGDAHEEGNVIRDKEEGETRLAQLAIMIDSKQQETAASEKVTF